MSKRAKTLTERRRESRAARKIPRTITAKRLRAREVKR